MKIARYILLVFLLSGCASVRVRHAAPVDLLSKAQVYGMKDIRAFSGTPSDLFINDFVGLLAQEEKSGFSFFDILTKKTYAVLAISGGSANGAYGAGLLYGWSKSGARPAFKIITGISTGAIIAPFVFIGSEYDDTLKEFYTKYSTKDIIRRKGVFQMIFGNSLVNDRPLELLIERYFDKALLKRVAAEYAKGRRLYVGSTNLDAQQLVVWDMGKIASIGDENALKLFRKVILASVTIPVAFPPVYFDVEADTKMYDEMHVDGGVTKQVFFLYDVLQGFDKAIKQKGIDPGKVEFQIYVIRNGYADAVWKEVPDKIYSIAERTIDTVTNAQGIGDIYQLYTFTKLQHGDFNLAYIPATHVSKAKEVFDTDEAKDLFDLGFIEVVQGYPWKKIPPGMEKD